MTKEEILYLLRLPRIHPTVHPYLVQEYLKTTPLGEKYKHKLISRSYAELIIDLENLKEN